MIEFFLIDDCSFLIYCADKFIFFDYFSNQSDGGKYMMKIVVSVTLIRVGID